MKYYTEHTPLAPVQEDDAALKAQGYLTVESYAPSTAAGTITFDDGTVQPITGLAALNRGWHGDIVCVSEMGIVHICASTRIHNRILAVIDLHDKQKYGINKRGLPIYMCRPLSPRYPPMQVASSAAKTYPCAASVYVLVTFAEWTVEQRFPRGTCVEVVGPCGDEIPDNMARAHYHALFDGYGSLEKMAPAPSPAPLPQHHERRDFRDATVFSIDPIGCVDIDDAVHVRQLSATEYEVGIHIADVTAFIEPGSAVDAEARARCQTIYMPHKQIPIIPEALAHNQCSLIPCNDRMAFSCIVVFRDGAPVSHEFVPTLIRSKEALTYYEVDHARYRLPTAVVDAIAVLERLVSVADDSHKLVERLMILANKFAAVTMLEHHNTVLLRRQIPHPDGGSGHLLSNAEYVCVDPSRTQAHEIVHVSVGAAAYTHFTSPIRRYADQVVHRILRGGGDCVGVDAAAGGVTVSHLNLQAKKHRRFQRDADILRFVHCATISAITVPAKATVLPLRYSRKAHGFKVDLLVESVAHRMTFPLRVVRDSLQHVIGVSLTPDGTGVTLVNHDTKAHASLVVGAVLEVTVYVRPREPRLYDKCVVVVHELAHLYDVGTMQ